MLAIEVTFLSGRYVATAYNSRRRSEWPPHPSRLFSAMACTHFESQERDPEERAALLWLEDQGPPSIHGSDASAREVATVFVPVNDSGVVDGLDRTLGRLDEARSALADAQTAGVEKRIAKAHRDLGRTRERALQQAAKATAVPAQETKGGPLAGRRLLPEHRPRQPRTFPSVTPHDPTITYMWPDADPPGDTRSALDRILSRLVRLGHSASLVSARLVEAVPEPVWLPDTAGERRLRVVRRGQVAALEAAHARHRETEPRVMPAFQQPYVRRKPGLITANRHTLFSQEWIVLRRIEGPRLPMTSAVGVARAVRGALMAHASDPVPEILSGHRPNGAPSERDHLAIVPLPFVGHEHARAQILGVALILPRAASEEDRRAVVRALGTWEEAHRRDSEDTPRVPVHLGRAGVLALERIEWELPARTLRPETWCRASDTWATVTPIALDRNPGDLWSRDSARAEEAHTEARAIIAASCRRIDLDPGHVEILPFAPVANAAKARAYPQFPPGNGQPKRVLVHAHLEFHEPVLGPVLLGAGRYFGLGLLRPVIDAPARKEEA